MYVPQAFRETDPSALFSTIRDHPLGLLITHGEAGIEANHIPFLLIEDSNRGTILQAHLARTNSQIDALRLGHEVLAVFSGPQAYITPSWYASKAVHGKVVPTWNYVSVQVRGVPRVIEDPEWLHTQISALTDQQEAGRAAPWQVSDAPPDFIAGLVRGIVGIEIPVTAITGKWKVSQNQDPANRDGVIAGLKADLAERQPSCPMAKAVTAWKRT